MATLTPSQFELPFARAGTLDQADPGHFRGKFRGDFARSVI
jgi:hypothetical protein